MIKTGKITNAKKLMLHCTRVNYQYMDLRAGQLKGYESMVNLYRRIAGQSLVCAQAMYEHKDCPAHDPATSAFWWANVSWALAIGKGIGVDEEEWYEVFVAPHISFALYLRPVAGDLRKLSNPALSLRPHYEHIPDPFASDVVAEDMILLNDIYWVELVIKLTARWGLLHHLKDIRALFQARRLIGQLRRRHSLVWKAYLESDILFLECLFEPCDFTPGTRNKIKLWLGVAKEKEVV